MFPEFFATEKSSMSNNLVSLRPAEVLLSLEISLTIN